MTTEYRPTVLVVEDDRATRELFEYGLRLAGFEVSLAADGLTALRFLDQQLPDAIVLDLELPWVTGLDIQQEVVSHAESSAIPIIVVTGTDWTPASPVYAVLRKPITSFEVVAMVQRALGGSSAPTGGETHRKRR